MDVVVTVVQPGRRRCYDPGCATNSDDPVKAEGALIASGAQQSDLLYDDTATLTVRCRSCCLVQPGLSPKQYSYDVRESLTHAGANEYCENKACDSNDPNKPRAVRRSPLVNDTRAGIVVCTECGMVQSSHGIMFADEVLLLTRARPATDETPYLPEISRSNLLEMPVYKACGPRISGRRDKPLYHKSELAYVRAGEDMLNEAVTLLISWQVPGRDVSPSQRVVYDTALKRALQGWHALCTKVYSSYCLRSEQRDIEQIRNHLRGNRDPVDRAHWRKQMREKWQAICDQQQGGFAQVKMHDRPLVLASMLYLAAVESKLGASYATIARLFRQEPEQVCAQAHKVRVLLPGLYQVSLWHEVHAAISVLPSKFDDKTLLSASLLNDAMKALEQYRAVVLTLQDTTRTAQLLRQEAHKRALTSRLLVQVLNAHLELPWNATGIQKIATSFVYFASNFGRAASASATAAAATGGTRITQAILCKGAGVTQGALSKISGVIGEVLGLHKYVARQIVDARSMA